MRKALLIAAMASLVVSAVVGIAIFLIGEFGDIQQKLLLTILAVGGFSLIGLACTAQVSSWWLWPLRPLGLATSLVALGVAVPLIWDLIGKDETVWKSFGTLSCVAVTSAHLALLGTFPIRSVLVWSWRSGAMLMAVAVASLIIGALWGAIDLDQREFYIRLLGVAAILDVLGTVGLYPWSKLVPENMGRGAKGRGRGSTKVTLSPSR